MKKVLLSLIAAVACFQVQTAKAQGLQFGVKGGLNIANITISNAGDVDDNRSIPSFNVGGYVDLPLAPVFSLQAGLMVSGKGAKYTSGDKSSDNWYEVKTNPIYLELPVNAVGKIPLGDQFKLIVGAGPYLAMGIAGKNSVEGKLLGASFSDDKNIEYGDDEPDNNGSQGQGTFKRFDFGLNFLAGLELGHFTVNANYGLGLTNMNPGSENDEGDKYKNRVFSVSVGFLF
jgi:hypothetical protein